MSLLQKLFSSERGVSGLAVDWMWNSVYWSSADRGTVRRMDTSGENHRTVLTDLVQPSGLVIDPRRR